MKSFSNEPDAAGGAPRRPVLADAVPDAVLVQGLRPLLGLQPTDRLDIVSRIANPRTSSHPSEIVTVRGDGGVQAPLFCKYEPDAEQRELQHRRGVEHEARVYEELLTPLGAGAPRAYGTWRVQQPPMTCLVVEALERAERIDSAGRVLAAARWLGGFHASVTGLVLRRATAIGVRYDRGHLLGWLERVLQTAAELALAPTWLPEFARTYRTRAALLANAGVTVLHGEFYPANLLASSARIWAIDWESAGTGPGEIDLAALTMGWPSETVDTCLGGYVDARWRGQAPPGLLSNLATARIYLCLRMLGNRRDEGGTPFFDYLGQQARACGFL